MIMRLRMVIMREWVASLLMSIGGGGGGGSGGRES
jgi:hypothetical protein